MHYADSLVGTLLDDLRAQGLDQNTIVLVTGDHAEEFNDLKLNYWGHNGNFSDYQLQVPFVLHWPGQASGHETRTSSHEDWVPTLMRHALGCENALSDFSTGQDLLAEPAGERALVVEAGHNAPSAMAMASTCSTSSAMRRRLTCITARSRARPRMPAPSVPHGKR